MKNKKWSVFLDRDGTVIEDRNYLREPGGVALLPGVGEALGRLSAAGCGLYLVTNQSGIGRGYLTEEELAACQERLNELLLEHGVRLTGMRFCPHAPDEGKAEGEDDRCCTCRKPGVGMWESLRDEHGLNAEDCVMVGDKQADVLFGVNAGFAASFLVLTGKGTQRARKWGVELAQDDTAKPFVLPIKHEISERESTTRLWLARDLNAVAAVLLSGANIC